MKSVISIISILLLLGCDQQQVTFGPAPSDGANGGSNIGEPVISDPEPFPQPPLVRIVEPPRDQIEGGGNAEVIYEIIVGDNPIENVTCLVDDIEVDCDNDGGTISVTEPGLGDHIVSIIVEDTEGLQDENQTEWTVHDRFVREKMMVNVPTGEKQADILFVIDNSISMEQEQESVAAKIMSFMQNLGDLSWRIAITTTDPEEQNDYGDGRLLPFPGGNWFLSSDMDLEDAKTEFAQTIQRDELGSGHERGIRAVYRSVERAFHPVEAVDQQAQLFYRDRAALSVVLISDEDESVKNLTTGVDLPEVEKSDGKNLVNLVKTKWSQDKVFQFHSIITRPGDVQCLRPNGTGYGYGKLYDQLSRETGGLIGDICSDDYGSELSLIGEEVAKLSTVYELSCVPQDLDMDGVPNVAVIALDNQKVPDFRVEDSKVSFNESLDVGNYQFVYFCLNTIPD